MNNEFAGARLETVRPYGKIWILWLSRLLKDECTTEKRDYFLKPKIPPLLLGENAGLHFGGEDFVFIFLISSLSGWDGVSLESRWSMGLPAAAAMYKL